MRHNRSNTILLLGVVCAVIGGASLRSVATAAILSAKRGFADVTANYSNLQATGAGWYYTWGPDVANPGIYDAKHIPMIWGGTPSQSLLSNLRNRPGAEWLLGFNEPEREDQANMSVAQAISSWTTIANGLAGSGIKLISPAVADTGGATGGQAWLADFMSQASMAGLPVDAVAFHWYGASTPDNPAGAASSFLSRVASYHNQYNKPVFITEFAIHDWGGNYSDAQISEANRQFLDIVIPELEDREYVMGYAWYHWFSDARLYAGNPPTPTQMGYEYVGVLRPGDSENIAGKDLGEHVAYLAGGELVLSSRTANQGFVRYINALESVSTIAGANNWGMSGTTNWIRVQPGATLRKSGRNRFSLDSMTVTNNGVLEVSQGELFLGTGTAFVGSGSVRVNQDGILIVAGSRLDRTTMEFNGGTVQVDVSATFARSSTLQSTTTFTGGGDCIFSGAIAGEGGLIKRGSGTMRLSSTNSYGGMTQVLEGTLVVEGTTGDGNTEVWDGGTLVGSGTIRGSVLAASGASIRSHSLTVADNFMLENGATLDFQITNDKTFDRLIVEGLANLAGDVRVSLADGYRPAAGTSFDLFDAASMGQHLPSFSLPALANNLTWDIAEWNSKGTLRVVAVPEPSAAILLAWAIANTIFLRQWTSKQCSVILQRN